MDIPGVIAFVFIDGDADSNSSGFSPGRSYDAPVVCSRFIQCSLPGSAGCKSDASYSGLAKKFSLSGAGVMESVKLSSSEQAVNKLATSPRKKRKVYFFIILLFKG